MTTHDDSVLFVAGLLITLSWALARGTLTTWLVSAPIFLHLLVAIVVNNRRLAWVELLLSLAFVYRLLSSGRARHYVHVAIFMATPSWPSMRPWVGDARKESSRRLRAFSSTVGEHRRRVLPRSPRRECESHPDLEDGRQPRIWHGLGPSLREDYELVCQLRRGMAAVSLHAPQLASRALPCSGVWWDSSGSGWSCRLPRSSLAVPAGGDRPE